MGEYLNKLVEQYKNATGNKSIDVNSEAFIKEFIEWVAARKVIGKSYKSFIDSMDINPSNENETVEINKGVYDSIALDKHTQMITPYFDGMDKFDKELITIANFVVYSGVPTIVKSGKEHLPEIIDTQYIRRFTTHNPYSVIDINNWEQLHNNGENITVGVFGNTYDKDVKRKISQLLDLKSRMQENFKEDYCKYNDMYYYVIASNRKVKKKTLTLTR